MALLRTLLALLTLALTIVSFAFTILTLLSPTLATSELYTDPTNPLRPTIATRQHVGTISRGPYRSYAWAQNATTGNYTRSAARGSICLPNDAEYLCQQMQIGAKTLIAGSAFTGAALLGGIALLFLASSTRSGAATAARTFVSLTLSLGALGAAVGGGVVLNVLVTQQWPDGDQLVTGPVYVLQDHWLIGHGAVFALLGWLPSVIALGLLSGLSSAGAAQDTGSDIEIVSEVEQVRFGGHRSKMPYV